LNYKQITHQSPFGGSQWTRRPYELVCLGSTATFNGFKGIVRYWAVVGADVSSSLTVCTLMLYARPGTRPLNAAWAGPGGSPSLST